MTFHIRPVRSSDAHQLNAIRRQKGVLPNTLGLPSERNERSEQFLATINDNNHMFIAALDEDDSQVIGVLGMSIFQNPRLRHSATFGISVHEDYQGMGVGKALMAAMIDLADNWLMLKRIELGVLDGNDKAFKLYESFGFEVEGVKRAAAVRNGEYVNETIMARIKL